MSYTIEDLDEAIENEDNEWDGSWEEFAEATDSTKELVLGADGKPVQEKSQYGDWMNNVYRDKGWKGIDIPGLGRASMIERFGGEGQGDQYWFVFSITDEAGNVRIFKRDGWHASYDGGYFEGPTTEVKPVEKTITVWEDL